ncbi:hypothetical protein [Nafulsella turpanensis]|uniref:hypothetical protein n=1 Tax=Nafulsella turpanensis TaxID=1265690 RepID=UPI0003483782|nr:hypothetical protein [Nafulsella turpanensis]
MPIKRLTGFVIFLSLWAGSCFAQAPLDSLQYRQAKLKIWCETAQFIYQDYKADSLLKGLNCLNWEQFRQSLRPNHLETYTFFEAVEKPAIYAGYTSFEAKLGKLVEEISKKLKASSSRRGNQARLQSVDQLQQKLSVIVAQPEVFSESIAGAADEGVTVPPGESEMQSSNVEEAKAELEEGWGWTELLQWLLIGLSLALSGWLWGQNKQLKKELNQRMQRRKQEIGSLTRQSEAQLKKKVKIPEPGLGEAEVTHLVRKEIDKIRQQQKAKQQRMVVSASKEEGSQPKPASSPVEQEKPRPAVENHQESRNGPAGLYYDKLPFKGGFHHNQLSPQLQPDSIYTIQLMSDRPEEARFWVTEDHEVQKYAMQNGLSFFEEACEYGQVEENPSRVRNLEKGQLRKKGNLWQIEKKVKVSFE